MKPAIIVHGGAWDIPTDTHEDHRRGCALAASKGYQRMCEGGSALDAVEQAVRAMEEDPTFDAGRGSFLNAEGEIELDAIIMDGDELRLGAVAAVQHILHPVTLARAIMERTPHSMLVGEGALRFARSIGMQTVDQEELLTSREMERWKEIRGRRSFEQREVFDDVTTRFARKGTVGAVALDEKGAIAAATSTGGTPNKLAGRVGDCPLVGCGNYADSRAGGVSATGWGESIMKAVLARRVCEGLERGQGPEAAATTAISYLAERLDGLGGVIVLTKEGGMARAFNTSVMAWACVDAEGKSSSMVERRNG